MAHERTGARYEAVDDQSREECTQQSLKSCQLGQRSAEEYQGQDKDVLHHSIVEATEKPASQPGEDYQHKCHVECTFQGEKTPCEHRRTGFQKTLHKGDYEQGCKCGERRGDHTDDHHAVAAHAVSAHDGVAHQCVRR